MPKAVRSAAFVTLALNVAATLLLVALVATQADVRPISRLYSMACTTLCWVMAGLPVSTAVAGGLLLRKVGRGTRGRRAGLWTAGVLLGFWGLFVASSILWSRGYSYEVRGVQYSEVCADWVVHKSLPPQSKDISAWIRPFRHDIAASFRINENDFLAWAKEQEWDLKEVHDAEIHNISEDCTPNDTIRIKDGWVHTWAYDSERPWQLFRVYAYDRSRGIGYFTRVSD